MWRGLQVRAQGLSLLSVVGAKGDRATMLTLLSLKQVALYARGWGYATSELLASSAPGICCAAHTTEASHPAMALSGLRALSAIPEASQSPSDTNGSAPSTSSASSTTSSSVSAGFAVRNGSHAGRFSTGSSVAEQSTKVDDYIGMSIAGATMLGQLRRLMLR